MTTSLGFYSLEKPHFPKNRWKIVEAAKTFFSYGGIPSVIEISTNCHTLRGKQTSGIGWTVADNTSIGLGTALDMYWGYQYYTGLKKSIVIEDHEEISDATKKTVKSFVSVFGVDLPLVFSKVSDKVGLAFAGALFLKMILPPLLLIISVISLIFITIPRLKRIFQFGSELKNVIEKDCSNRQELLSLFQKMYTPTLTDKMTTKELLNLLSATDRLEIKKRVEEFKSLHLSPKYLNLKTRQEIVRLLEVKKNGLKKRINLKGSYLIDNNQEAIKNAIVLLKSKTPLSAVQKSEMKHFVQLIEKESQSHKVWTVAVVIFTTLLSLVAIAITVFCPYLTVLAIVIGLVSMSAELITPQIFEFDALYYENGESESFKRTGDKRQFWAGTPEFFPSDKAEMMNLNVI